MAQLPSFQPFMASPGRRYYCHQCESPFFPQESPSDTPVCPVCQSEFVEAIENEPMLMPHPLGAMAAAPQLVGNDTDDPEQEQVRFPTGGFPPSMFQPVHPRPGQHPSTGNPVPPPFFSMRFPRPGSAGPVSMPLQEHLRNVVASHGTTGATQSTPSQTQTQTSQTSSKPSQAGAQRTPQRESSSSVDPPPARRPRQDFRGAPAGSESTDGLADLHFSVGMPWYFMLHHRQHTRREQQAAAGAGRGGMLGTPLFLGFGGPSGDLLHSSPGDYVWGPQGIDNMISQMLASLDDPGPPPAEQSKVDALPTVTSTSENLKNCSLCSVCKEDFSEGESLLKLPCEHLYHKDCILPWLKLHDTCPTCRYHLNTGKADEKKGPV